MKNQAGQAHKYLLRQKEKKHLGYYVWKRYKKEGGKRDTMQ